MIPTFFSGKKSGSSEQNYFLIGMVFILLIDMKKRISQLKKENIQFNTHKHRLDIRDNLVARINEEQTVKGNDITHNKKEHRKPAREKT